MSKKTKSNTTGWSPYCSRFKTPLTYEDAGYWTWSMGMTVETDRLYGFLDKPHDHLHWKPKNTKIEYDDVTDEEINELYLKAKEFWRNLLSLQSSSLKGIEECEGLGR